MIRLKAIFILIGWIFLWALIVQIFQISADFLPSPFEVLKRFIRLLTHSIGEGPLVTHLLASMERFLTGFIFAAAIGVPIGFFMAYFKLVDRLITPLFEMLRPIPPIAWAPFAILWFGASHGSQAFVILLSALPPIIINSYLGIKLVDKSLIDAAKVMGASSRIILLEIGLPWSLPLVFAGLRIGLATGWMALIAAEIVAGDGSNKGLGFLILTGQRTLHAELSICSMIIIGVIGSSLDYALKILDQHFMRWKLS